MEHSREPDDAAGADLDHELGAELRAEVRRLKTLSGRSRTVAPLLHVGTPGGARLVLPLGAVARTGDPGMAGDVLTRAFDRMRTPDDGAAAGPGGPQVWLTRTGSLVPGDLDWEWRAGADVAQARHGIRAGAGLFFVVTRIGWLALPSGATRTWSRMRPTWQPPYGDDRDDLVVPDPIEGWPVRF